MMKRNDEIGKQINPDSMTNSALWIEGLQNVLGQCIFFGLSNSSICVLGMIDDWINEALQNPEAKLVYFNKQYINGESTPLSNSTGSDSLVCLSSSLLTECFYFLNRSSVSRDELTAIKLIYRISTNRNDFKLPKHMINDFLKVYLPNLNDDVDIAIRSGYPCNLEHNTILIGIQ